MKRFLQFCLFLFLSLSASALDDGQAKYVGGTVPGVTAGIVGRLETTSETSLIFEHAGHKMEIPYASIESHEYSKEVARHLGVLPTIVIGLIKVRQHRHFFRISYRPQGAAAAQVVVFEVPKHTPRILQAILQTRAPGTCKPVPSPDGPQGCGVPCDCLAAVTLQKLP